MIKPRKNKRTLLSWRAYRRWYKSNYGTYIITAIGSATENWVLTRVKKKCPTTIT